MKCLVFGQNGQVAKELARLKGDFVFLDRTRADLMDPSACAVAIANTDADAVINAAAYTAVDKAEEDEKRAYLINGAAPAAMARAAAAKGIPFVHISTDYVFEGGGEAPWCPSDPTGPLGVYGASKLEGEQGVIAAGGAYGILRTSWVFSSHGANFVKTMQRLAETRDHLTVVGDQIGGPTPAAGIAAACAAMAEQLKIDPNKAGIYHYSGSEDVSSPAKYFVKAAMMSSLKTSQPRPFQHQRCDLQIQDLIAPQLRLFSELEDRNGRLHWPRY
jgi:dTDP-4-dehydrorhamnose reductase